MANVTPIEPQVLIDLLALNIEHAQLVGLKQDRRVITVVSPWLTDVELALHPSGQHSSLGVRPDALAMKLSDALRWFCANAWQVNVAVLRYGESYAGLSKDPAKFQRERSVLKSLVAAGARVFLCPGLHAKGIATPLGVVTGTTNYTHSGLHLQMQNAFYFAFDHPDYPKTYAQLCAFARPEWQEAAIP